MIYSETFMLDTDNLCLLEGPQNQITGAAITNTPAVTSAKARFFDDAKDTYLTADASTSAVTISVTTPGVYAAQEDSIVLVLDDGTWFDAGLVTAIDEEAGTVTVTNALTGAAGNGGRVCCRLGAAIGSSNPWEIDMTYYDPIDGSAATAGNFDYGWYGVIPDSMSLVGWRLGKTVRVEMVLDVVANVKATQILRRLISGGS